MPTNGILVRNSVNNTLLIRADFTERIGGGHFVRSFAIAEAWKSLGGGVVFCSRCESEIGRDLLAAAKIPLLNFDDAYPNEEILSRAGQLLGGGAPTIVLFDGYTFSIEERKAVCHSDARTAVIDDPCIEDFSDADLILNYNIYASTCSYRKSETAQMLLGTKYCPIRSEFMNTRPMASRALEAEKRILLMMGASDAANVTSLLLSFLGSLNIPSLSLRVIVGPLNTHFDSVLAAAKQLECPCEVIRPGFEIVSHMTWATHAITACGSSCYEFAYLGVPMLGLVVADNQQKIAEGLSSQGCLRVLGSHRELTEQRTLETIRPMLQDASMYQEMSQRGLSLIDGRGAKRIAEALAA